MSSSAELREQFLRYFEGKGHRRVASSPLVPFGDPSLLFVNAGMVQFKDVFLGVDKRPYVSATTVQKCLRVSGKHNDLDAVGRTARHHTFFEMLGNFSFGDYFKRDAIRFAWELTTEVFGLPKERLWVTVFEDDDEAAELWAGVTDIDASRIVGLGAKDNFWEMGDTGPCGPCSEMHYDRGPEASPEDRAQKPGDTDGDRFLEFYNLVFMQFDKSSSGDMTPLPSPSVDTGLGLERLAALSQGVESNWETDLFQPLILRVAELAGIDYDRGELGFPHRVIADHARAATFLIGDGIVPGNEGRGYVLRRIMRRAIRLGRTIGLDRPFLDSVSGDVVDLMSEQYPELKDRRDFIRRAISSEEEKFNQTLSTGLNLLDEVLAGSEVKKTGLVPGEEVFRLYDTYGFPKELTEEVAAEAGLNVDSEGFKAAMERQREQARSHQRFSSAERAGTEIYDAFLETPTRFLGYERLGAEAHVLAVVAGGELVDAAFAEQPVEVLLDQTPFYAEAGGQIGDAGTLRGQSFTVEIDDTQSVPGDLIVHVGRIAEGSIEVGATVTTSVDTERRLDVARNHTATHLLNAALRVVLGSHVQQAGSLVAHDRLRFDFSHLVAMSPDEIGRVESMVNSEVMKGLRVRTETKPYDQAMKEGALAFFGDKYGDQVRVVTMADDSAPSETEHFTADRGRDPRPFSVELCGGTHLLDTSQIGFVRVVSESSIGAGIRRMEAVTGPAASTIVSERLDTIDRLVRDLQTPPDKIEERVATLLEELSSERRHLQQLQREVNRAGAAELLAEEETLFGARFIRTIVEGVDGNGLREMANEMRSKLGDGGVALAALANGKPIFVVALSQALVARGLHAGNIVRELAVIAGGGGGGRPEFGQAGGKDPSKVADALEALPQILEETSV